MKLLVMRSSMVQVPLKAAMNGPMLEKAVPLTSLEVGS
jgi:hypothetical protein